MPAATFSLYLLGSDRTIRHDKNKRDKKEPVADASPVEEQIASLEQDEIGNVDLTLISGGVANNCDTTTGCCCCYITH